MGLSREHSGGIGKQVTFTTEGHGGEHRSKDLDMLGERCMNACRDAIAAIEERQAQIHVRLEHVAHERAELGAERHALDQEARALDHQQSDLDEQLAELAQLRASAASGGRWCCCSRPERNGEIDVAGDHTIARVSAVNVVRVKGAGSHEVNGSYVKTQDSSGDTYFLKREGGVGGKALYFNDGQNYGLPPAWYIADNHRGLGIYVCSHDQEETLPFAGWDIYDVEDFSNPGLMPPPLLQVES